MALVKYIGHKPTKKDNVAGTNTVWTGHGDVRSVPNKALDQILKHPTVWQLVSDDDLTTAAETALAGGLAQVQPAAATVTDEPATPVEPGIPVSKVRDFIDAMLKGGRLVPDDLPVVYGALGLGDPPAEAKPLPPDDADAVLAAEAAANAAAGLEQPKDPPAVAANMSHTNPENDEDGDVASRPGTLANPPGTVVEPPKATNSGRRQSKA